MYRRTGSPFLSALTFSFGFLPFVLGGGLLSGVVDRIRPRRLVSASDLGAGLITTLIAAPGLPVPVLLALLFVVGMLTSVGAGARTALVRAAVGDDAYVPARSLLRVAGQGAQIAGNAFGGALVVALSPSGAILVDAVSFVVSAALVRLVVHDHPTTGDADGASLLHDSLRGAREILGHAELRRLLLLGWVVPMFSVAPEALAAPYVSARHGSAALVGIWLVALPVGVVIGDVLGVRFLAARQQRRIVVPAAAAGFVPYLAFLARPPVSLALGLLVASGLANVYSLGLDGRVRDAASERLFARAMTLNSAGLMTLQGAGFALAGAVAQALGSAVAIAAAGACGLIAVLVLARMPRRESGGDRIRFAR